MTTHLANSRSAASGVVKHNTGMGLNPNYSELRLSARQCLRSKYAELESNLISFQKQLDEQQAPHSYVYYTLAWVDRWADQAINLQTDTNKTDSNNSSALKMQPVDVKQRLWTEGRLLKSSDAPLHRMRTAARARNECLERLRRTLQGKEAEILQRKLEIKEEISHLRLLTTNVIDEIKRWRDKMAEGSLKKYANESFKTKKNALASSMRSFISYCQLPIFCLDDSENYLIRLLNDTQFIFHSPLSVFVTFGTKNDPFLLAPLAKAAGKEQSSHLDIVRLDGDKDSSHYQRYMEYLAEEKASQLEIKRNHASQKELPVLNQIQKTYGVPKGSLEATANSRVQEPAAKVASKGWNGMGQSPRGTGNGGMESGIFTKLKSDQERGSQSMPHEAAAFGKDHQSPVKGRQKLGLESNITKTNPSFLLKPTSDLVYPNETDKLSKQQVDRMRERQERFLKNQQRINLIKNIYKTGNGKGPSAGTSDKLAPYATGLTTNRPKKSQSERKLPETDTEAYDVKRKRGKRDISPYEGVTLNGRQPAVQSVDGFEEIVKNKLVDRHEASKNYVSQTSLNRNATKGGIEKNKSLQKIATGDLPRMGTGEQPAGRGNIEAVRQFQSSLRMKLNGILDEDKKLNESQKVLVGSMNSVSISSNDLTLPELPRVNSDLISSMKQEIMLKLQKEQKEREKIKQRKREEEQKALEEVRTKMKKEMEEQFEIKKRQKLIEREELEKKLKEQETRLDAQRDMEKQLQVKLAREKELRELERLKREGLEKEKKLRDQLHKEQALRRQRQDAVQKQRHEKQKLLQELRMRDLRDQVEGEVRKELKEGNMQGTTSTVRAGGQARQAELSKEIELLKARQALELQQIRKQNELRERMLKDRQQEEQMRLKSVEQLMKSIVVQERDYNQKEAIRKRMDLQDEIRSSVKQKLLEEHKAERETELARLERQRQRQLQEDVYRDKVREKLERQMRMEAVARTKRQIEERETRRTEIRNQMEPLKAKFDEDIKIDRGQIEQQVRKQLMEQVVFDKQAQKEAAKHDLRLQFEKELLASSLPTLYAERDNHLLKEYTKYEEDGYLDRKMAENKQSSQKQPQLARAGVSNYSKGQVKQSNAFGMNQNPTKKINETQRVGYLNNQQKQIYSKKREKVDDLRPQVIEDKQKNKDKHEEEGFELVASQNEDKLKQPKYQSPAKTQRRKEKAQTSARKKKPRDQSEEEEDEEARKRVKRRLSRRDDDDSEEQDRLDEAKRNKRKRKESKTKKTKREEEDSQVSDTHKRGTYEQNVAESGLHERSQLELVSAINPSVAIYSKTVQSFEGDLRDSNKGSYTKHREPAEVNQSRLTPDMQMTYMPIEPITLKQSKLSEVPLENRFRVSLQAIPEAQLDEYLGGHFSKLPELQVQTLLLPREQLYRKLIGELTFCLLLGHLEHRLGGMAFAYHDRSKLDLRKFIIVHIGTYSTENYPEFILAVSNFIFKKDPCDQIEFFSVFDESQQKQLQQSQTFNKWFDRYGSVYQKKVGDTKYERKYVLRRQFNQRCQVQLGGVNKNSFRNIFSVSCGVVMSDSDLLQNREELREVSIAAEHELNYLTLIAELFRTYLTPDEAEALKNKVKQFAKLKEMLILVVTMQKKKLKLEELKLTDYKTIIELNMRLMSQGKDLVRFVKDGASQLNRIYYCQLTQAFNLPFQFQTTSLPIEANEGEVRQISYFRMTPLPPNKLYIIKSSLYNGQMNVLPTENNKYKLFVIQATEYLQLREKANVDLFMYIRLFLKNVRSHNVAVWKYVWLPQMATKFSWNLREFKSFLKKDFYAHDSLNISYKQFLPNALMIQPQHRDLVITPPFIVGVMSMSLEQISEGSPLYTRLVDVDAMRTLEIETQ